MKPLNEIVAEVYARRLDSPLDSALKLTDSAGKQLPFNDDHEDKGQGLITHQADSCLSAKLPSDGTYFVHLGDVQHNGGPEYAYRLRISPPRPDFDLRVVPSSVSVRGGATVALSPAPFPPTPWSERVSGGRERSIVSGKYGLDLHSKF